MSLVTFATSMKTEKSSSTISFNDEASWLSTLRGDVLVIGNGPLGGLSGDFLDASETIVRFNNYKLGEGFGSRMTHWVVAGGFKNIANPMYMENEPTLDVAFVPWTRDLSQSRYAGDFTKRTGVRLVFTKNNDHITRYFPKALERIVQFPSTGFCLCAFLFKHDIRPTVVGFDGMIRNRYGKWNYKHDHKVTQVAEYEFILDHCKVVSPHVI